MAWGSFLPEGHPLLFLPYLRAVHRVLGIVLHSDQPPPYLHVSDSGSGPLPSLWHA